MKDRRNISGLFHSFNLGISIGVFISLFINVLLSTSYFSIPTPALVGKLGSNLATFISLLGFGFIGIFSNLSGFVFNKEEWSLLKATIIHFILLQILLLLIGYIFSWLSYYFTLVLPISFAVYLIIWLVSFFHYKNEVSKLKSKL
ncbi:MAG: DUF3021 domain-containing protein [Pleomorphochaeta sp.]